MNIMKMTKNQTFDLMRLENGKLMMITILKNFVMKVANSSNWLRVTCYVPFHLVQFQFYTFGYHMGKCIPLK